MMVIIIIVIIMIVIMIVIVVVFVILVVVRIMVIVIYNSYQQKALQSLSAFCGPICSRMKSWLPARRKSFALTLRSLDLEFTASTENIN